MIISIFKIVVERTFKRYRRWTSDRTTKGGVRDFGHVLSEGNDLVLSIQRWRRKLSNFYITLNLIKKKKEKLIQTYSKFISNHKSMIYSRSTKNIYANIWNEVQLLDNTSQVYINWWGVSAVNNCYFIFYFIPFAFSQHICHRHYVRPHTGYITYSEHRRTLERVAEPWIYLSSLLLRGRRTILLCHTSAYGSIGVNTRSCLYCLWHQFNSLRTACLCPADYQWVSIP